ncbi:hypothetical protein AB3S75_041901 [Citrus x aurantiifolia]
MCQGGGRKQDLGRS